MKTKNKYLFSTILLEILLILCFVTKGQDTLKVSDNSTYTINSGETETISELVMGNNSNLIINGTLRFETNGVISDFKLIETGNNTSFFRNKINSWMWLNNIFIQNNGNIECNSFTQFFSNKNDMQASYTFYNNGDITCEGNFYSDWTGSTNYVSSCEATLIADTITFQGRAGWKYNGVYQSNVFIIDVSQGGGSVDFGSEECTSSEISTGIMELKNNVSTISIKELTKVDNITLSTYNTVKSNVTGIFAIGGITNSTKLNLEGGEESIINICYNPTVGVAEPQSLGNSNGYVLYLQSDVESNAWKTNTSPKEGEAYNNGRSSDISGKYKAIAASKVRQECIDIQNFASLLPIQIIDFHIDCIETNHFNVLWYTESEINNREFVIEWSEDGKTWEYLDRVDGSGTTSIKHSYSCKNQFIYKGIREIIYFRLSSVDFYGNINSYDIRSIIATPQLDFKTLRNGQIDILYNKNETRIRIK